MQVVRRIALAVDSQWYKSLEAHNFLKESQFGSHPTDLLIGAIESEDINGIWIKPDNRFSNFSKSTLLVPWRHVVSAALLGQDEEASMLRFPHP